MCGVLGSRDISTKLQVFIPSNPDEPMTYGRDLPDTLSKPSKEQSISGTAISYPAIQHKIHAHRAAGGGCGTT